MPTNSEPVWIIFDGRAILGDTEDAAVLESFGKSDGVHTDAGAIKYARHDWRGYEFALYRYDLNSKREAHNEQLIHVNTI